MYDIILVSGMQLNDAVFLYTGISWRYCRFGLVSNHNDKVNIGIKGITQIFWLPSAHKSDAYTIL